MTAPHPTYPNPVIAESLCELHVRKDGADDGWPTSMVGDFYQAIQANYPEMEPVTELGVELSATDTGIHQRFVAPRTRFRFRDPDSSFFVHLGAGVLSVNVLAPYPGWEHFRERILSTWQIFRKKSEPSEITRIGLRYINRIPRETSQQPPRDWLQPSDFLAPATLKYSSGFSVRSQVLTDPNRRTIVSLQDLQTEEAGPCGSIVFDIDRITESPLPPEADRLSETLDDLHEDVWNVFQGAKTVRLEEKLNESR